MPPGPRHCDASVAPQERHTLPFLCGTFGLASSAETNTIRPRRSSRDLSLVLCLCLSVAVSRSRRRERRQASWLASTPRQSVRARSRPGASIPTSTPTQTGVFSTRQRPERPRWVGCPGRERERVPPNPFLSSPFEMVAVSPLPAPIQGSSALGCNSFFASTGVAAPRTSSWHKPVAPSASGGISSESSAEKRPSSPSKAFYTAWPRRRCAVHCGRCGRCPTARGTSPPPLSLPRLASRLAPRRGPVDCHREIPSSRPPWMPPCRIRSRAADQDFLHHGPGLLGRAHARQAH